MSTNEARVSFTMAGYSFNTDDVTHVIGLEPTSTRNGNTRVGDNNPALSSWELSSDKVVDDDIDITKMVNSLIAEIEPVKEKLLIVIENLNLVPKITVKLILSDDKDEPVPDISVGSRAVKFLASIGAFIEVETKKSR